MITTTPTPANQPVSERISRCRFRCSGQAHELALEHVLAVLEPARITPLPPPRGRLLGWTTFHREVLPVARLGPDPTAHGVPGRCAVLVLQTSQGIWGLAVEPGVSLGAALSESKSQRLDPEELWRACRAEIEAEFRRSSPAAPPPLGGSRRLDWGGEHDWPGDLPVA